MPKYTYKNIGISVDNNQVYANAFNINYASSITPLLKINDNFTNTVKANRNATEINLEVSYYLTGKDYIKTLIENPSRFSTITFGNKTVYSGILTSYSLSLMPNQPITATAEFSCFNNGDEITLSSFSYPDITATTLYFLNAADIVISGNNGFNEEINGIEALTYNYKVDIEPKFRIQSSDENTNIGINIEGIQINSQTATININTLLQNSLNKLNGESVGANLSLRRPEFPHSTETLFISGFLISKNLIANNKTTIHGDISIEQFNFQPQPYITSKVEGTAGDFINIIGHNLYNVQGIYFNGMPSRLYTASNDRTYIALKIPEEALSGKCIVKTYGGEIETTGFINYPPINIEDFWPITGYSGEMVTITGSNFYYISDVYFGNGAAQFERITSNLIFATVPSDATYDYLKVRSDIRNISGTSSTKFVPFPYITSINPLTGNEGYANVEITGSNFKVQPVLVLIIIQRHFLLLIIIVFKLRCPQEIFMVIYILLVLIMSMPVVIVSLNH